MPIICVKKGRNNKNLNIIIKAIIITLIIGAKAQL